MCPKFLLQSFVDLFENTKNLYHSSNSLVVCAFSFKKAISESFEVAYQHPFLITLWKEQIMDLCSFVESLK